MIHPLAALLSRWESEGAKPLPAESPEAVHDAFQSLGMTPTADVLLLYTTVGGMRSMDDEYWRLWSLEEVRSQQRSEHGVLFGDYCIFCWEYRLVPISPETSAVYVDRYDNAPPVLVAASLEQFLERLHVDARSLLDAESNAGDGSSPHAGSAS
jgi:hypothetical protein